MAYAAHLFVRDYVTLRGIFIKGRASYLEDFIAVAVSFLVDVPLVTRILILEHKGKHE